MARKRMIDPSIWDDEGFSDLSFVGRLLFIGMFSYADDYGKGRANPKFLKSKVFPYDDMRVAEVDKALSEIGHKTSVQFYCVNGQSYYIFKNWKKWQKVEKPTASVIPDPEESNSGNPPRILPESSPNIPRPIRKEDNITPLYPTDTVPPVGEPRAKREQFLRPTVDEVGSYCKERGNRVDPQQFVDFYESKGWKVGNQPMKDWRAAVRTWEKREPSFKGKKGNAGFSQRDYSKEEMDSLFSED